MLLVCVALHRESCIYKRAGYKEHNHQFSKSPKIFVFMGGNGTGVVKRWQ